MKWFRERPNGSDSLTTDQLRMPVGKARQLLLAAVGGEPSDAAAVWEYGAADRGAGGADGVEDWDWQANIWGRKRAEAGTTFWRSL